MKAKQQRDADMIDLVGMPRRDLPAEIEAIKLPKRGMASVVKPVIPARSAIDPSPTGSIGPAQTTLPETAATPDLQPQPLAPAPDLPRRVNVPLPPVRDVPPLAENALPSPSPSPTIATAALPPPREKSAQPTELYASLPSRSPVDRQDALPLAVSPLGTLFEANQKPMKAAIPAPTPRISAAKPPDLLPDITPAPRPTASASTSEREIKAAAAARQALPVKVADARQQGWQGGWQENPRENAREGLLEDEEREATFSAAPLSGYANQRSYSKEWELPRARRASGRPALNATPAPSGEGLPSTRINYIVRSQPLEQILREIGQMVGARVMPGPGIKANIRERRLEGPANAVFDKLTKEFGLFWFTDGGVVHVDPVEDSKTRFFKVRNASAATIEATLAAAGLGRVKDRVQAVGGDGMVRATGPESFLKSVEAVLTGIETEKSSVQLIKFGQKGN